MFMSNVSFKGNSATAFHIGISQKKYVLQYEKSKLILRKMPYNLKKIPCSKNGMRLAPP